MVHPASLTRNSSLFEEHLCCEFKPVTAVHPGMCSLAEVCLVADLLVVEGVVKAAGSGYKAVVNTAAHPQQLQVGVDAVRI